LQIISRFFTGLKKNNNKVFEKLSCLIKTTKHFIKNHPNVIFTRADKGNITVALDRNDYIAKDVTRSRNLHDNQKEPH